MTRQGMRRPTGNFVRFAGLGLLLLLGGCLSTCYAQADGSISSNEGASKKGSSFPRLLEGIKDALKGREHSPSKEESLGDAEEPSKTQNEYSSHEQKNHDVTNDQASTNSAEGEELTLEKVISDARALDGHVISPKVNQIHHAADEYKRSHPKPPRECDDAEIGFDELGLEPGDYLSDQFEPLYGLTFTSKGRGALGDHPRIFDTANPYKMIDGRVCGDKDLGAPNGECPDGGPGEGDGGVPRQPGENCDPQGNALIIQEDNSDNVCGDIPNDNEDGGEIILDFSEPVDEVYDIDLLDVDYASKLFVTYLDDDGEESTKRINLPLLGDNSLQILELNEKNVVQLRFKFRRSGAITKLRFCHKPPSIPTKRPTPSPIPKPTKRPTPVMTRPPTTRAPTTRKPSTPPPITPAPTSGTELECEDEYDDWVNCVEGRRGCISRCDTSIPGDAEDFFTPGEDCDTFFAWVDENEGCCNRRKCKELFEEFLFCKDCEEPDPPTDQPAIEPTIDEPTPHSRKPTPYPTPHSRKPTPYPTPHSRKPSPYPTPHSRKPTPYPTPKPKECEDVEPRKDNFGNYICEADCPVGEGDCVAVKGRRGKYYCECKPECEDADPRLGCDGTCPGDTSGDSCVKDGKGGCTCDIRCEDVEPDEDGNCLGFCPDDDDICAPDGSGGCDCLPPCEDAEPDEDGNCLGFCPDDDDICAPDGSGGCDCLPPCEDAEPDDDGNCLGFCPDDDDICAPVGEDECACTIPIPVCSIKVDKRCIVPTRPIPSGGDCDGKVRQLTLIWTGNSPVNVSGQQVDKSRVEPGEALTITFDSSGGNDRELQLSGGVSGVSEFHVSCSDKEMDGPEDCGKLQGNGKKNEGGVNLWALEALVSTKGGGFDCGTLDAGGDGGQDDCELITRPGPSCDTGKPDTITFLFNGGTDPSNQCLSSTINKVPNAKGKLHKDFECSGRVNPSEAISVELDKGGAGVVQPGQQFTVDLKAIKKMRLSNGGGTQNMEFHTSCSQPIAVGLTAGALTIVALDGQFASSSVRYEYEVTNMGDNPVVVTEIEDDVLGSIIDDPETIPEGQSRTFEATYDVPPGTSSVTNEVVVVANSVGSSENCSDEDSVTVKVTQGPPIGGSGKGKGKSTGFSGSGSSRLRRRFRRRRL